MSVGMDARYRGLASVALAAMGVPDTDVMERAITAQWQCEQPANAWPPVHNNPGFVTKGAMASVGVITYGATTKPGIGFLSAFTTPEEGARAYGTLIGRGHRYQGAVAAARRNDGATYIHEITSVAHYGTGYTCSINAYKANGGKVAPGSLVNPVPTPGPPSAGPASSAAASPSTVLAVFPIRLASTCAQVTIIKPTGGEAVYPIPGDSYGQPCVQCAPGYNPGIVTVGPIQWIQGYHPPVDNVTPNACVRADLKPGDNAFGSQLNDAAAAATAAVGEAIAGLPGAFGNVAIHVLLVVVALGLMVLGLKLVATDAGVSVPGVPGL